MGTKQVRQRLENPLHHHIRNGASSLWFLKGQPVQLGSGDVWPHGRHVLQVEIHELRDAPDLTLPNIPVYGVAGLRGTGDME